MVTELAVVIIDDEDAPRGHLVVLLARRHPAVHLLGIAVSTSW